MAKEFKTDKTKFANRMVDKSIEAFLMGLEIYNKPTIKYRVEGFSFFICNAWELLLKATLIEKGQSIYYGNKPDRTISLHDAVRKIYSDEHTRIRLNLEKIIELRNISTHFITEEYEVKYAPLFQACVLNYTNEMERFQGRDITKYIPQNFLTISARYEPLNNEQIKLKYPAKIAEKLIQQSNEIDVLQKEYDSDKFSINIAQHLYITRKKKNADFTVKIEKDSQTPVAIVKDMRDPSEAYRYSYNNVIAAVNDRLHKKNIKLNYKHDFNSYVLNLVINFYGVKGNPKFSYEHIIGNLHGYTYSQSFVEFITQEIKKDPQHFVESLKKSVKK